MGMDLELTTDGARKKRDPADQGDEHVNCDPHNFRHSSLIVRWGDG